MWKKTESFENCLSFKTGVMAHTLEKLGVNVEPGGEFQIELYETFPLSHILTVTQYF